METERHAQMERDRFKRQKSIAMRGTNFVKVMEGVFFSPGAGRFAGLWRKDLTANRYG